MKKCTKCGIEKSLDEFHRRTKNRKTPYQSWCKLCAIANRINYYKKNKKRENLRNEKYRQEFATWARNLKNKACADCKQFYHHSAMQWDHLPSFIKKSEVGTMVAHQKSKESILKEIEKCELVCANCHAIRTFNRRQPE